MTKTCQSRTQLSRRLQCIYMYITHWLGCHLQWWLNQTRLHRCTPGVNTFVYTTVSCTCLSNRGGMVAMSFEHALEVLCLLLVL